ncbi:hypothetical protein K502DRAFT_348319 [Neoconidiobolus thromboides FSU 785]|nr:hypothetical protein K502DRAFT_348319 [Neoconidiobolus thromboides FSU 785]
MLNSNDELIVSTADDSEVIASSVKNIKTNRLEKDILNKKGKMKVLVVIRNAVGGKDVINNKVATNIDCKQMIYSTKDKASSSCSNIMRRRTHCTRDTQKRKAERSSKNSLNVMKDSAVVSASFSDKYEAITFKGSKSSRDPGAIIDSGKCNLAKVKAEILTIENHQTVLKRDKEVKR